MNHTLHFRGIFAALLALALLLPMLAQAIDALPFKDRAEEQRFQNLTRQLRCLVCQNESIEDSGADLARDLRRIVRQRVVAGDTDAQVVAWMVARYGNFVRLSPPLEWQTLLLWGSPVLALGMGGLVVLLHRRNRPKPPEPLSEAEQARLRDLMKT